MCTLYKPKEKYVNLERATFGPRTINLKKNSRGLLDDATYLISRLKWFQTMFFHVSHFKKSM